MVQFEAGSSHLAKVVMTNPTSAAFDYDAVLYMGINMATMDEIAFHLNAGESKEVVFDVVMPTTVGEYPVYIGVFSGGVLLGHYQSIENVTITAVVALAFAFSNLTVNRLTCESADAWNTLDFWCTITNPHDTTITHTLTPHYRYEGKTGYSDPQARPEYAFILTLSPGQSHNYYRAGNLWSTCIILLGFSYGVPYGGCAFLRDENGNDSPQACI